MLIVIWPTSRCDGTPADDVFLCVRPVPMPVPVPVPLLCCPRACPFVSVRVRLCLLVSARACPLVTGGGDCSCLLFVSVRYGAAIIINCA